MSHQVDTEGSPGTGRDGTSRRYRAWSSRCHSSRAGTRSLRRGRRLRCMFPFHCKRRQLIGGQGTPGCSSRFRSAQCTRTSCQHSGRWTGGSTAAGRSPHGIRLNSWNSRSLSSSRSQTRSHRCTDQHCCTYRVLSTGTSNCCWRGSRSHRHLRRSR